MHRDLKPANIFLTLRADGSLGDVKIGDFGLAIIKDAKKSAPMTKGDVLLSKDKDKDTTTNSGTPIYRAPEQEGGGLVDTKADMFALGIVLIEMFQRFFSTGQRLNVLMECRARHRVHESFPLSDHPEAAHLIQWLLQSDSSQRPTPREVLGSGLMLAEPVTNTTTKNQLPSISGAPGEDSFTDQRVRDVHQWLTDPTAPHSLMLVGGASVGKTSIYAALVRRHKRAVGGPLLAYRVVRWFPVEKEKTEEMRRGASSTLAVQSMSRQKSFLNRIGSVRLISPQPPSSGSGHDDFDPRISGYLPENRGSVLFQLARDMCVSLHVDAFDECFEACKNQLVPPMNDNAIGSPEFAWSDSDTIKSNSSVPEMDPRDCAKVSPWAINAVGQFSRVIEHIARSVPPPSSPCYILLHLADSDLLNTLCCEVQMPTWIRIVATARPTELTDSVSRASRVIRLGATQGGARRALRKWVQRNVRLHIGGSLEYELCCSAIDLINVVCFVSDVDWGIASKHLHKVLTYSPACYDINRCSCYSCTQHTLVGIDHQYIDSIRPKPSDVFPWLLSDYLTDPPGHSFIEIKAVLEVLAAAYVPLSRELLAGIGGISFEKLDRALSLLSPLVPRFSSLVRSSIPRFHLVSNAFKEWLGTPGHPYSIDICMYMLPIERVLYCS